MERVDEPTPNGGAYSEVYYMDENLNIVDKSVAVKVVVRECDQDGNLLSETWGDLNGGYEH